MVQRIQNFAEGLRKGVAIKVECRCGKHAIFPTMNFLGYIRPGAAIEELTWRCTWCRGRASALYIQLDILDRESLAQWMPSAGMRRRW